jgi:hypothetical protein
MSGDSASQAFQVLSICSMLFALCRNPEVLMPAIESESHEDLNAAKKEGLGISAMLSAPCPMLFVASRPAGPLLELVRGGAVIGQLKGKES